MDFGFREIMNFQDYAMEVAMMDINVKKINFVAT